jgi:hypothetical protein
MSENSDEELRKLLKELGALDEVPRDVAARLDATVEKLAAAEKSKKSSRLTTTSWALAAGFTLVFGLGVVLNLDSSPISQTNTSSTSKPSEGNEDDVLTSTGEVPTQTSNSVPQYSSGIDYSEEVSTKDLPFTPTIDYGSIEQLPTNIRSCIDSLELEDAVSLVDLAKYKNQNVTAVWSALTSKSWQVLVISDSCEGIDEVFVGE